jgi:ankyrin repeat protein
MQKEAELLIKLIPDLNLPRIQNSSKQLSWPLRELLRKDGAIIEAASNGDVGRVSELLSSGANVNARDRRGWSALSICAHGGYIVMAQLLLNHGADLNNIDVDGNIPEILAANRGHSFLASFLGKERQKKGDDPEKAQRRQQRNIKRRIQSGDCFSCAKKLLTCSREVPSCSQCLSTGNVCSGYKAQLSWGRWPRDRVEDDSPLPPPSAWKISIGLPQQHSLNSSLESVSADSANSIDDNSQNGPRNTLFSAKATTGMKTYQFSNTTPADFREE